MNNLSKSTKNIAVHINKKMQQLQDQIDALISQQTTTQNPKEMRINANKIGALQCKLERLINIKKQKKTPNTYTL